MLRKSWSRDEEFIVGLRPNEMTVSLGEPMTNINRLGLTLKITPGDETWVRGNIKQHILKHVGNI